MQFSGGAIMSKLDRVLVPGSTEVPNCRCGTEMHLIAVTHLVAAGAACFTALSPNAYAQSYPTRSVHIIVGFENALR
jgi:hypothetical protein